MSWQQEALRLTSRPFRREQPVAFVPPRAVPETRRAGSCLASSQATHLEPPILQAVGEVRNRGSPAKSELIRRLAFQWQRPCRGCVSYQRQPLTCIFCHT